MDAGANFERRERMRCRYMFLRATGAHPYRNRSNEHDLIQHAGRMYRRVDIPGAPDASAPNGQPGGPHH